MAEHVRRRITAARVSVSVAVAAVIAGVAGDGSGAKDVATFDQAARFELEPGSITSKYVQNGSLLYRDFKRGELYSKDMIDDKFWKIGDANLEFLTIDEAADKYLTIAAGEKFMPLGAAYDKEHVDTTFLKLTEAAEKYLTISAADQKFMPLGAAYKKDEADATFYKAGSTVENSHKLAGLGPSEFVRGDGSVFTGVATASEGNTAPTLLEVPDVLTLAGDFNAAGPSSFTIENKSAQVLTFVADNQAHTSGVIDQTASASIPLDDFSDNVTLQVIVGSDRPSVITLTLGAVSDGPAADAQLVAQGIAGPSMAP